MAQQHMEALAYANDIRLRRAALKREIRARPERIQEVLREEIPYWLEGMLLADLMNAYPRIGARTIDGLLAEIGAGRSRQVGELTARQRAIAILLFEERDARRIALADLRARQRRRAQRQAADEAARRALGAGV